MPLNPQLLEPIPGDNPGGINLKYDPVFDRIKEARREDDDTVPQGAWERDLKKADWPLVVKLCSEALANKTKDLQLAVWLTEALVRREGFAGLRQGLELCQGLIDQFWDSLFPEQEDDDLELRAMPLDWLGGRLGDSLYKVTLTSNGLDWFKYKDSRTVGYEADADSDEKRERRAQAISDGKIAAEEFDKAVDNTPKAFYTQRLEDLDTCLAMVQTLSESCESKFADFNPSYGGLREALEAVRQVVNVILKKKRATEPDEGTGEESGEAPTAKPEAEPVEDDSWAAASAPSSAAAAAPARAAVKKVATAEPASREDACERIAAMADWLRKQDPYDPTPYVVVRAMRWGELRYSGSSVDSSKLEAPPTETRTQIKRLLSDGTYEEALQAIEEAAGRPFARGWLDLQRYFCQACDGAGSYDYAKNAVVSEVKALLADYPELSTMSLLDDTPTANPETQTWLASLAPSRQDESQYERERELQPSLPSEPEEAPTGAAKPPDVFQTAGELVRSGQLSEAIALLTREAGLERSGRAHFQRRFQVAQICVASGHDTIAYPILEGLAEEIDTRRLEGWESPELLANVLRLLFRCIENLGSNPELKERLYARICRLDPIAALELGR